MHCFRSEVLRNPNGSVPRATTQRPHSCHPDALVLSSWASFLALRFCQGSLGILLLLCVLCTIIIESKDYICYSSLFWLQWASKGYSGLVFNIVNKNILFYFLLLSTNIYYTIFFLWSPDTCIIPLVNHLPTLELLNPIIQF